MAKNPPQQPDFTISKDDQEALGVLAPIRVTVERIARRRHDLYARAAKLPVNEPAILADVEAMWSVVLETYRRGCSMVVRGLRVAEGVDHEMIDDALEYGLDKINKKDG